MKGLLLKDWFVAAKYCRIHIGVVVLMSVISAFADTGIWYLFYPLLFAGMIPVYILSVDEKAEWASFALTLPVERRDVVTVKYLDALISVGGAVMLMTVIWLGRFLLVGGGAGVGPLIRTMLLMFSVGLLLPALMLPLMLRYGVEKGRYLMIAGVVIAVVLVAVVANGSGSAPRGLENLYAMDIVVRSGWRPVLFTLLALAVFGLSRFLANRMFEQREL